MTLLREGVAAGWIAVVLSAVFVVAPSAVGAAAERRISSLQEGVASDSILWEATVARLLRQDLWSESRAYNAAHFMMVPLHAAFLPGHEPWLRQFAAHFGRFEVLGFGSQPVMSLSRLQYAYLASRFVALAAASARNELVSERLRDVLYGAARQSWAMDTGRVWGQVFVGQRDRLAWKLSVRSPARGYYRAVTDPERFLFGIAADLRAFERVSGTTHQWSPIIDEILAVARRTFEQRVVHLPDGGWLFQPGVPSDHPDYAYAGQSVKVPGMAPAPLRDVAEDASHSFRMPLILTSLVGAYAERDSTRRYYERLRDGLTTQFLTHVLVPPTGEFPAYRLTNFMDGRNGVYRLNYLNRGVDWGYGPYELSGSLTLGWWAFLGQARVRAVYERMAAMFPLAPLVRAVYRVGVPRGSVSPPNVNGDTWASGLRELIVRLAARL